MAPNKNKKSKSKERDVAPLLKNVTVEKIDETVKAAAATAARGKPIPVDSDSDDAASTGAGKTFSISFTSGETYEVHVPQDVLQEDWGGVKELRGRVVALANLYARKQKRKIILSLPRVRSLKELLAVRIFDGLNYDLAKGHAGDEGTNLANTNIRWLLVNQWRSLAKRGYISEGDVEKAAAGVLIYDAHPFAMTWKGDDGNPLAPDDQMIEMCGGVKEAEEMMLLYISYLSALMGTWCKAFGRRAPVVTFGEYAERLGAMLGDVADVVGRAIHPTAGFIFMRAPSRKLKLDKHMRGTDRALEAIARIQDIELLRGEIKYWPVWTSTSR